MGRTLAAETRKPSISLQLHSAVYYLHRSRQVALPLHLIFLICNTEVLPCGFIRLWGG